MTDCIASRDCIKDPIKKECRKYCLERILRTATPDEKRLVLGYTDDTANAIFRAYNNYPINSYDDLALHLSGDQQIEILTKFDHITQFQLDYFQLDPSKRNSFFNNLNNPGLNMGDQTETRV